MSLSAQVKRVFAEPQKNVGLRGEPFLWNELREHFLKTELPDTSEELLQLVASKIEDLIGSDVRSDQPIFVERYDSRGMSVATSVPKLANKWPKPSAPASPTKPGSIHPPARRPTKAASSSPSTNGPLTSIPPICIQHEKWRKRHEKVIWRSFAQCSVTC